MFHASLSANHVTKLTTLVLLSCFTQGANWALWSDWGACAVQGSTACDHGSRDRFRYCMYSTTCVGDIFQQTVCSVPGCSIAKPVAGQWGPWTTMSPCSVTCGAGKLSRFRSCDNPAPSTGGAPCTGSGIETYNCYLNPCKVDGTWGAWQSWSPCSVSCDMGQVARVRSCDNPAPSNGGSACSGNSTETHDCSAGPCSVWSQWYDGACSVTCGNGTIVRLRHCSTGRDVDCNGEAYAHVPCMQVSCLSEGT